MSLNLFENLKKDIEFNVSIKNFMEEVSNFIKSMTSSQNFNKCDNISNESKLHTKEISSNRKVTLDEAEKKLKEHRIEGHLYFVTEDRNNEIYLWDFTDKPKHEFKEIVSSEELLNIAKEGAMLQYKNGKYELYSADGYDMLFNEE